MSPVESEIGYYFCELTYRYSDLSSNISDASENALTYLMTRDYEGFWRIASSSANLPAWVYKHETQFGNAIDESLGIRAVRLEIKTP
jgi:hypothetical protein